jgi:tetratricopeptide (TPR) repeat protein
MIGLLEAKLGPDHPDTLGCRINLANAYSAAGRTDEAIALLTPALKLLESRLGPDHPSTLTSRYSLASAYLNAGRTADAIVLLEATLNLQESTLGPDHPSTLLSRNDLAAAFWRAGQLDRSVPLFERSFRERVVRLGADHPETLGTEANLGVNYRDAGRPVEGARLMEDAFRRAGARPDVLAKLAVFLTDLAAAYDFSGRFAKAEPLYRDALVRARKSFGLDDPRTAAAMALLGMNLLKQAKWSEAEPVLRACLAVREKTQPDAWGTFNTRSQLGGALLGQGRYGEAEPLIISGYEGMKARAATIPAPGKDRLPEAALRVVRLYVAWGKPEQAKAWKERLGLADLPKDVFTPP